MLEFKRPAACETCGQKFNVSGSALNPSNETQSAMVFSCPCGGRVIVQLPGSVNKQLVRLEPVPENKR